jgi:hypothetical protein
MNCCFQLSCAAKLPWEKSIVGVNGKVTQVKWKVYNIIEGRDKLLVPKSDLLWKHVGQRKATITSIGVAIEGFYFLKMNQHVLNEKVYVQKGKDFVWQQVVVGVWWKGKNI